MSTLRRYELVVLDMAGTTVFDNDNVAAAVIQSGADYGYIFERDSVNAVMGIPKPLAITRLLQNTGAPEATISEMVPVLFTSFQQHMKDHYRHSQFVRPIEGVEETLAYLSDRGLSIALDTGFDREIVDVILERLAWSRATWLKATVASDEVANGRPAPDLIIAAMEKVGVQSSSSVVKVGDTPADMQEGNAAGCGIVVGVSFGTHSAESLKAAGAHVVIDHISELIQLLAA